MKRVFFISILALACMVCTTSCSSDDDGGTALTGINVAPQSISLAVDGEQKVTVTFVPAGATAEYTITSGDANVATVTGDIVKITGVGTTTVTVTSGTFVKTIPVEGLLKSIAVKDANDKNADTYDFNGTPISFTLTATLDPANSGKTPEWSSNVETATVTAAANGLTAEVTIIGSGAATITAAVGGISGSYTITTESVFESAVGYWTFNDETNLGKATKGDDLEFNPAAFIFVEGPSDAKKAIRAISLTEGAPDEIEALQWAHRITGEGLTQYTVLMDARIPVNPDRRYYCIIGNEHEGYRHSIMNFRWRNGILSLNQGGGTYGEFSGEFTEGNEPWVRAVFLVRPDTNDGKNPEVSTLISTYGDGALLEANHSNDMMVNNRFYEAEKVRFMDHFAYGNPEYYPFDVSTIAVWDHLLTDEEIASLGGVSK